MHGNAARHTPGKDMDTRRWITGIMLAGMLGSTLAGCTEATDPVAPTESVRASGWGDGERGGRGWSTGSADEPGLFDLLHLALFTRLPAPGAEVAHAWIGAEGGTLSLDGFEIIVPAGAVSKSTHFMIRRPPQNSLARLFVTMEAGPHGKEFAVPVTIRMPLSTTTAAWFDDPTLVWWHEGAWVPVPSTVLPDGRIEAQTTHFSRWGLSTQRGVTIAGG